MAIASLKEFCGHGIGMTMHERILMFSILKQKEDTVLIVPEWFYN